MDYQTLKKKASFINWIYVKVGTAITTVGELWRVRNISGPDEQYVVDYRDGNVVKRIGDY